MWHLAEYHPTTLFSLRPANATTSGGKTLVTPTPFAVKMALLDAAIRVYGRAAGELWFPLIRDLSVAVRLPERLVVINTFIKILRPHKSGPKDTLGTGLEGPMGNTIAYRELVHFGGPLSIGLETTVAPDQYHWNVYFPISTTWASGADSSSFSVANRAICCYPTTPF